LYENVTQASSAPGPVRLVLDAPEPRAEESHAVAEGVAHRVAEQGGPVLGDAPGPRAEESPAVAEGVAPIVAGPRVVASEQLQLPATIDDSETAPRPSQARGSRDASTGASGSGMIQDTRALTGHTDLTAENPSVDGDKLGY